MLLLSPLAASLMIIPASVSAASAGPDAVSAAVSKASGDADAIVTPADRAMMEAKCGRAATSNTKFQNGALICSDGRRVDDAETQAMSKRISKRADAHVQRVMNDPGVKDAIDGAVHRRTAAALRRAADRLDRQDR